PPISGHRSSTLTQETCFGDAVEIFSLGSRDLREGCCYRVGGWVLLGRRLGENTARHCPLEACLSVAVCSSGRRRRGWVADAAGQWQDSDAGRWRCSLCAAKDGLCGQSSSPPQERWKRRLGDKEPRLRRWRGRAGD
ncbi:hypothetical protein BHE74_00055019, partial [Ensete ventricosum]